MENFLRSYELDSARKSEVFPDCVPMLTALKELGAKVGLVTNTSSEAVEIVVRNHDLNSFFDLCVSRKDVKRLKPDPEGILLAVERLKVRRFVMVGDLALDVFAARAAGGVAILIKRQGGRSDLEDFSKSLPQEILEEMQVDSETNRRLRPDYVVHSLAQIPRIVEVESGRFSIC